MSSPLVSYPFAREYGLFDSGETNGALDVFFRQDGDLGALSELQRHSRLPLRLNILSRDDYQERLARVFNAAGVSAASMVDDISGIADLSNLLEEMPQLEDLLAVEASAPVIRLINALLAEALRKGASDVHFEMFEARATVRFRIDGQLCDVIEPRRGLHSAIVSRIKVMAGLDIAEKRLPQDGRIALRIAGRPVDVRVSTLPTGHGERVVLRLLDKSAGRLELQKLGMSAPPSSQLSTLSLKSRGLT